MPLSTVTSRPGSTSNRLEPALRHLLPLSYTTPPSLERAQVRPRVDQRQLTLHLGWFMVIGDLQGRRDFFENLVRVGGLGRDERPSQVITTTPVGQGRTEIRDPAGVGARHQNTEHYRRETKRDPRERLRFVQHKELPHCSSLLTDFQNARSQRHVHIPLPSLPVLISLSIREGLSISIAPPSNPSSASVETEMGGQRGTTVFHRHIPLT